MTETAEILTEIKEMKAQMNVLTTAVLNGIPEWVTIQKACELKGVNINTINRHPHLQPRFGVPDKREGTRKYWKRATVLEWLPVLGDRDRIEYAKKYPAEAAMSA